MIQLPQANLAGKARVTKRKVSICKWPNPCIARNLSPSATPTQTAGAVSG